MFVTVAEPLKQVSNNAANTTTTGNGTLLAISSGPAGPSGRTILSGTVDPLPAIGTDGDFYINTTTNKLFGPRALAVWGTGISLVGPTGATGASGVPGSVWLHGVGVPSNLSGNNGDFYLNDLNTDYYVKANAVWTRTGNLGTGVTLNLASRESAVNVDVGTAEYVFVRRYWNTGPDVDILYKVSNGTVLTGYTRPSPSIPLATPTDITNWQNYVNSLIQVQFANGKLGTIVIPDNFELTPHHFGARTTEVGKSASIAACPDDTAALQNCFDYCSQNGLYVQLGKYSYRTLAPLEWGIDASNGYQSWNYHEAGGIRGAGSGSGALGGTIIYVITNSLVEQPYLLALRNSQHTRQNFSGFDLKGFRYTTDHVYSSPCYNDTFVFTYGVDHKECYFTNWSWYDVNVTNCRNGFGSSGTGVSGYLGNGEFEKFEKCGAAECQRFYYMVNNSGQSFGQMFVKCIAGGLTNKGCSEYVAFDMGQGTGGYGLHVLDFDSSFTHYSNGFILSSNLSTAVTGVGTNFVTDCPVGTRIYGAASELLGIVASVTDATHLTLVANAATTYTAGINPGAVYRTDKYVPTRVTLLKDHGITGVCSIDGGRIEGYTTIIENQNPYDSARTIKNMDLAGMFSSEKNPTIISGKNTGVGGFGTIIIQDCTCPVYWGTGAAGYWPLMWNIHQWPNDGSNIIIERCTIGTTKDTSQFGGGFGVLWPFVVYTPPTAQASIEFKDCIRDSTNNGYSKYKFNKFYGSRSDIANNKLTNGIPGNLIRVPELVASNSFAGGAVTNPTFNVTVTANTATCTMTAGSTTSLKVGQLLWNANCSTAKPYPWVASIINATQFTVDDGTKITTSGTGVSTTFGIYADFPWVHETNTISFWQAVRATNGPWWFGGTTYAIDHAAHARRIWMPPGVALYQDVRSIGAGIDRLFVEAELTVWTNSGGVADRDDCIIIQIVNSIDGEVYDEVRCHGNNGLPQRVQLQAMPMKQFGAGNTGSFRIRISSPASNYGESNNPNQITAFNLFKLAASNTQSFGPIPPAYSDIRITTSAASGTATVTAGINELVAGVSVLYDNPNIPNGTQVQTITKTSDTTGTITFTQGGTNVLAGTSVLTRAAKTFTQNWNVLDRIKATERLSLPLHDDYYVGKSSVINDPSAIKVDVESDIYISTNSGKITYAANNNWWEIPRTKFAAAMPTTGSWMAGDFVENTAKSELGTPGSKYIIHGWDRITTGSTNVATTDWLQRRTLTGN